MKSSFTAGWFQEPSNKKVKPVAKSNSHTGVITPSKTPALKRIGQSISVTTHKCYNRTINNSVNCTPRFLCVVTFFFFFFFITAVYKFSYRRTSVPPASPTQSEEGFFISTSAQQPVLEWHCGESWAHREGDQTSRGGDSYYSVDSLHDSGCKQASFLTSATLAAVVSSSV